jgi:hypothetical protein
MGSLPDQVYLDEIPKLRAYPNIRTLGYVATNYAEKDIEDVLAEIEVYSRWPKVTNIAKMRVDGIFLDETPSTSDADDYAYLKRASQAIRNGTTFGDRFIGMYMHHSDIELLKPGNLLTLDSAQPRPHTHHDPQLQRCIPGNVSQLDRPHRGIRRDL